MQKIPVPVVVAIAVVAVILLGVVLFKTIGKPGGDTGNINAINAEILKNNPKGAPELPPDTSHAIIPTRGKRSSQ